MGRRSNGEGTITRREDGRWEARYCQRARHTNAVGLRESSEARNRSTATRDLSDGKMPTTGSPTTEDIEQVGLFAISEWLGRPT
jgi:hypothetical protein